MRVHDRFIASRAVDPVRRLIGVHARSLATARKHREAAAARAVCRAEDRVNCRVLVNALLREIDRLRRGLDATVDLAKCSLNFQESPNKAPDAGAAYLTPGSARPYAVAPLGDVSMFTASDDAPSPSITHLVSRASITNLGTVLNVIA